MPPAKRQRPDLDIVGFGALNVDYIVAGPTKVGYFDELERGEEHNERNHELLRESIGNLRSSGQQLHVQLGGSALNTVRALAGLAPDLKLGFVSIAGGCPADLPPETDLQALKSSVEMMVDWEGGPIGTCVSVLNDGERTLTTYNNDLAAKLLGDPERREAIVQRLLRAKVVHITSVFGDDGPRHVAKLMAELRRRNRRIVLSVDLGHVWSGQHDARDVLRHANYVFANEAELHMLSPIQPADDPVEQEHRRVAWLLDNLSAGASRIAVLKKTHRHGRGSEYVGRAGAAIYQRAEAQGEIERHELFREALPSARIADSTGAGDAFAAGVLAAMHSPRAAALWSLKLGFSAARHKMLRPGVEGYAGLESLVHSRMIPPGRGKVFISHARSDRELVDALESLIHAGSPLPREQQFFCSSLVLQGPRPSTHLRRTIWDAMRAAECAIFVVTADFVASRECSYELGAAAVLGIPSIPLLAPGVEFANDLIPVSDDTGGRLDDRQALAAVQGEIAKLFGHDKVDNQLFDSLLSDVVAHAQRLPSEGADTFDMVVYGAKGSTRSGERRRRQPAKPDSPARKPAG